MSDMVVRVRRQWRERWFRGVETQLRADGGGKEVGDVEAASPAELMMLGAGRTRPVGRSPMHVINALTSTLGQLGICSLP